MDPHAFACATEPVFPTMLTLEKDMDVKISVSAGLSLCGLALIGLPALAQGAESPQDYGKLATIVKLPAPVSITDDGSLKADASKWKIEKEADGTELLTSKKNSDVRIAAIKSKDGLESFTYYSLQSAPKSSSVKPEESGSLLFQKGKLTSYTACEDTAAKDSIGRVCVTATPKLCQTLKKAEAVGPEIMKEMDVAEMRSLAIILTLRGPDHQLDNVVRFGNRLGLKSALQTTKGQIIALARQIAKETGATKPDAKLAKDTQGKEARDPAATSKEDEMIRTQLEHSIPRLKQACADTGFLN